VPVAESAPPTDTPSVCVSRTSVDKISIYKEASRRSPDDLADALVCIMSRQCDYVTSLATFISRLLPAAIRITSHLAIFMSTLLSLV